MWATKLVRTGVLLLGILSSLVEVENRCGCGSQKTGRRRDGELLSLASKPKADSRSILRTHYSCQGKDILRIRLSKSGPCNFRVEPHDPLSTVLRKLLAMNLV